MKRTLQAIGLTVGLTGGVIGLTAGIVSAHSNHVRANCNIGVNVEAHDYPAQPAGASASVTVEYDGNVTFQQLFGPAIKANAANPDKTKPHLYRVTFDRFNYVGPDGDAVYTGTIPACQEATTTTAAPTTTVPATTTTGPEIPCVTDENGHSNFQGTNIPCTPDSATDIPPVPSTTITELIPPEVPTTQPATPPTALPKTGDPSERIFGFGMVLVGLGALLVLSNRRRTTR